VDEFRARYACDSGIEIKGIQMLPDKGRGIKKLIDFLRASNLNIASGGSSTTLF